MTTRTTFKVPTANAELQVGDVIRLSNGTLITIKGPWRNVDSKYWTFVSRPGVWPLSWHEHIAQPLEAPAKESPAEETKRSMWMTPADPLHTLGCQESPCSTDVEVGTPQRCVLGQDSRETVTIPDLVIGSREWAIAMVLSGKLVDHPEEPGTMWRVARIVWCCGTLFDKGWRLYVEPPKPTLLTPWTYAWAVNQAVVEGRVVQAECTGRYFDAADIQDATAFQRDGRWVVVEKGGTR